MFRPNAALALLGDGSWPHVAIGASIPRRSIPRVLYATTDEILGVTTPKATGPLAERRVVRRIQDIERLPRRKKSCSRRSIRSSAASARRAETTVAVG